MQPAAPTLQEMSLTYSGLVCLERSQIFHSLARQQQVLKRDRDLLPQKRPSVQLQYSFCGAIHALCTHTSPCPYVTLKG